MSTSIKMITSTSAIIETHEKLLAICRPVLDGSSSVDAAVSQIKQLTVKIDICIDNLYLLQNSQTDTPSYLRDVLEAIEYECEFCANVDESRQRLLALIKQLSGALIPDEILKLDLEILGASEQPTKGRVIKTKTRLLYVLLYLF